MTNGKGDRQRNRQVTRKKFALNWKKAFKRKREPGEWGVVNKPCGRVDLVCQHGISHPSEVLTAKEWEIPMGVHECDGCCKHKTFKEKEVLYYEKRALYALGTSS